MKPTFTIAVRALVEHVLRCGDLRSDFMGSASALEGLRAHQRIQRQRPAGYQAECPVRLEVDQADFTLSIGGRIDGVLRSGAQVRVEEIKTTQRPLAEVQAAASAGGDDQELALLQLVLRPLANPPFPLDALPIPGR